MYGYTLTALRVVRKDADDAPLQIDNIDGQGLDLASEWRRHFRQPRSDYQIRARRYWQSARASRGLPRNGVPWVRLDVEYGSNGVPGRVVDTTSRAETAQVRPQDATLSTYRHVLTRPRGGGAALLAGEQIGRTRALSGPLDAFVKAFEASQPDFRVTTENVADGEYWQQFVQTGDLMSATLTRQQPVPAYLSPSASGSEAVATVQTTVKPAGRGVRWAAVRIVPDLLNGVVTPADAFGIGFEPDETSLVIQAQGQQRTVQINASEAPWFTYPVGDLDRPDRPDADEFYGLAEATIDRLMPLFRLV